MGLIAVMGYRVCTLSVAPAAGFAIQPRFEMSRCIETTIRPTLWVSAGLASQNPERCIDNFELETKAVKPRTLRFGV